MSKQVIWKGGFHSYFVMPLLLGALLIPADILVGWINLQCGVIMGAFLAAYFIMVIYFRLRTREMVMEEMVSFATQYGQVQKRLLRSLEIPYGLLDEEGKIIWTNFAFDRVVVRERISKRKISSVFPTVTSESLPKTDDPVNLEVSLDGKSYRLQMHRIPMSRIMKESEMVETGQFAESLIAVYLFDETEEKRAIQKVDDESLVVGFIYMDNYEEALESVEEVRRSLLIALIDRKINKYIASMDGICAKIEKDKYLVTLRKKAFQQLRNAHFELLNDVKTVSVGDGMPITVSIGLGVDGATYAQNYDYARNAIDLALGRGGDQAVVKMRDNTIYYGGKTQQMEKNTRVKARVKAQALKEILNTRETVYIMGHRLGDMDCLGAGIGIYRAAVTLNREAHIVLNEISTSIQPVVDMFRNNPEYPHDLFLTSAQAMERFDDNDALVVVDVNRPSICECPELIKRAQSIVVLDHHRAGSETIENATLSYVEAYASSACEMVAEVLQYIDENVKMRQEEADALYAGMVMDTNNFQSKTGVRTFEAAAFLRRNGVDVTRVRKLFREDSKEYKARADAVSQAEIYRKAFAISICPGEGLASPTIAGAQAANELLNIKGVKASFVMTEYQKQIFVSARSIDEVNVQLIMEHMGGGGHMNIAGCQIADATPQEVIQLLKHTIDTMIDDGEL